MRVRIALVLALALLTAVPADAARDRFVRDSPGSAVATCLRPAGASGMVGLFGGLERRMSRYDLLRVSADGVSVVATAQLGVLDECPAVAAAPSGHAIMAGAARARRFRGVIRAVLAEPGGQFGAPVEIARTQSSATPVAAAVSPHGDAVLAWPSVRGRPGHDFDVLTRVVAAVRPAGGSFGRPQPLTPWRRASIGVPAVSAAMDASGTATVAWGQPIPDRGNIPQLSTIEAAGAPPGGRFGPAQSLTRAVQDMQSVTLAVAPDGRALLAHDGQGMIQVFERPPGGSGFSRVRRLRTRHDEWQRPEVAVAADGSALVAWRGAAVGSETAGTEDVLLASRRATGAWTEPVEVQRSRQDDSLLEESFGVQISTGRRPSPPLDLDNTRLRAVIGPDGRYLVSWGRERPLPLGDRALAARIVRGETGGAASRAESAGCACRSVNGIVPVALAGGELLLSYTDNVTLLLLFGIELPKRSGRLHVAEPGPPDAGPEPPRLTIRAPRAMTLGYRNKLRVRVGCDRACDLRAYVVGGRGRARGVAVATLRRPGRTRLAIRPVFDNHLAPPSRGRARVVVHGYAPNASRFARRAVAIDLRRKPLRPLPELLNVRAVQRRGAVIVTWETARPAKRVSFEVRGRLSRRERFPIALEGVAGRGRRRFSVRLPDREVRELGGIAVVAVSVVRDRPPFDRRTVVVPVSG